MSFITNSNPINLLIVCVFSLVAVFVIVKTIKELTLKVGNNTVSFSSKKTQSEVIKVVTDYADFKYKIKEEQAEGLEDLHSQAKRIVSIMLNQYIKRISVDYANALESEKNESGIDKNLAVNIFSLLMKLLYNEIFKFCMDIYESNHLKDRSDSELKELSEINHLRIVDVFKEFMQMNWFEVMGSYEVLHNVCVSETDFTKNLLLQMLVSFRDLSRQKYELINTINDIDCKVREKVQNTGTLPINAISILSDLYIPGTGLNRNSVEKWLGEEK